MQTIENMNDLLGEPKSNPKEFSYTKNQNQQRKSLAIIDGRTTTAHKFRTKLGFKIYGVILTKEESVLLKIKSSFE